MASMADVLMGLPERNPQRVPQEPVPVPAAVPQPSAALPAPMAPPAAVPNEPLTMDQQIRVLMDMGLGGLPDLLAVLGDSIMGSGGDGSFNDRLNQRRAETSGLYDRLEDRQKEMVPHLRALGIGLGGLLPMGATAAGMKMAGAPRAAQIAAPAAVGFGSGYSMMDEGSPGERASMGALLGGLGGLGGRVMAGAKPKLAADPELVQMFKNDPAAVITAQLDPFAMRRTGLQVGMPDPYEEAIGRLTGPLGMSRDEIRRHLQAARIKFEVQNDPLYFVNGKPANLRPPAAATSAAPANIQTPTQPPQSLPAQAAAISSAPARNTGPALAAGAPQGPSGTQASAAKAASPSTGANQSSPTPAPAPQAAPKSAPTSPASASKPSPPQQSSTQAVNKPLPQRASSTGDGMRRKVGAAAKGAGRNRGRLPSTRVVRDKLGQAAAITKGKDGRLHDASTGRFVRAGDKSNVEWDRAAPENLVPKGAVSWRRQADRAAYQKWLRATGRENDADSWNKFTEIAGRKK